MCHPDDDIRDIAEGSFDRTRIDHVGHLRRLASIAVAATSAFLLSACNPAHDAAVKAEREYHLVEHEGGNLEKCQAAKAGEAAYLKAEDKENFERWRLFARIDCELVELEGA